MGKANIFATNLRRILFLTELDPPLPLEFFASTMWPQNVTLQSLPTLIPVSSGAVAFSEELQTVQETGRKIYNHTQAPYSSDRGSLCEHRISTAAGQRGRLFCRMLTTLFVKH